MQAGSPDPLESPETGLSDMSSLAEGEGPAIALLRVRRPFPRRLHDQKPCGRAGGVARCVKS
jgi:hypothetical protein